MSKARTAARRITQVANLFSHPSGTARHASLTTTVRSAQMTMSTSTNKDARSVLDFWFGLPKEQWYGASPETNAKIKNNYGSLVTQARNNELDSWKEEPSTSMALVIVLDQFPRNLFKGSGEAFSSDAKARDVSTFAYAREFDKKLSLDECLFLMHPFFHCEELIGQVTGVALAELYLRRYERENPDNTTWGKRCLWAAREHRDLVLQFGRFPGRNKALGRKNTKEEEDFLEKYPSGMHPLPDDFE